LLPCGGTANAPAGVRATAEGGGLGSDGGGGRGGVKGLSRRSRFSINSSIDTNAR